MSKNTNYNWQLPEKEVLNAMYENKRKIGGFADDNYWSSSETNANVAWYQNFYYGDQNDYYEDYFDFRVRAVRVLPENHKETERIFKVEDQEYQAYEKDALKSMDWYEAIEYCKGLNEEVE